MNYQFVAPADPPIPSFVLYTTDSDGRRVLRDEYRTSACTQCGRVDEMKVVKDRSNIDDLRVRGRKDLFATSDWFLCVSERLRDVIQSKAIHGATFVPLVRSPAYSIMIVSEVDTDISKCQMKFIGSPCPLCCRYRESLYRPFLGSMSLPSESNCIFMPKIRPEKSTGRICMLVASEGAAQLLRNANLTGIDWQAS